MSSPINSVLQYIIDEDAEAIGILLGEFMKELIDGARKDMEFHKFDDVDDFKDQVLQSFECEFLF